MPHPATLFQGKTTPEVLMRISTNVCHQLGKMHQKYSSLSTLLTQSPNNFDVETIETLSSFVSDCLDQREMESYLDQNLLETTETDPSEALFMVLKMRCHVIESIDCFLDPLLERIQNSGSFIASSGGKSQASSSSREETPTKSILRRDTRRAFARIRQNYQLRESTSFKKQVQWADQILAGKISECFDKCNEARKLRMDLVFKKMDYEATAGEDAWQWECLKQAAPLIKRLTSVQTQQASRDSSSADTSKSASQPALEDHSDVESNDKYFFDSTPSSVIVKERERLKALSILADHLDPQELRSHIETLSSKNQHELQRRIAVINNKFRKGSTKPDRSWGKRNCFKSKRINSLRKALKSMSDSSFVT